MSDAEGLEAAIQGRKLAERRELEARNNAQQLAVQNAKLQETLRLARDRLQTAQRQLAAMSQPPLNFGVVAGKISEQTVEVFAAGRHLHVSIDPTVQPATLTIGTQVLLNESLVIIKTMPRQSVGTIAVIRELLSLPGHVIALCNSDELVLQLSPSLQREEVRHGDSVLIDRQALIAYAKVARQDVEDLVLEEVPELDYSAIGGLAEQIQQVRDAVELPFLHRDLFNKYGLAAPKGVLLYGPPGCGKTMIAKAVAHSLANTMSEATKGEAKSYFLNIKGPELLNKYVGETERQIRVIFQRAREKATAGMPVIVFFDEMDSLFRTRGSGVSSDVENTIVPQLLSEIDGVEGLENVIIIGASNREDMIDPAILRPGRLDVKIKLDRPHASAAKEIFSKYLTADVPLHAEEVAAAGSSQTCRQHMIDTVVDFMYSTGEQNRFLEVTYAGGDKEVLYFKDFTSGAMISSVVNRAKKMAIKAEIDQEMKGVRAHYLLQACLDEFVENEDLPNTTNPDDWARISGKRGERIVFIRTLVGDGNGAGRSVATQS